MSKRVMPDNKALVQNKKPKSDDLISGETPPHQQHRFNDDLVKELTKSLQPHIPALNSKLHNLAQAVAPALAKANVFLAQHQNTFEKLAVQLMNKAQPILEALAKIDWASLQKSFENLDRASKEALNYAAEKGWFFSLNESTEDTINLMEIVKWHDESALDAFLSNYYRENLEHFTTALIARYPHRLNAISAAVEAHNFSTQSGYLLSIPVLLAQADGIASDITGHEMPLQGKPPRAAKWFKEKFNSQADATQQLHPLLELHLNDLFLTSKLRDKKAKATGNEPTVLNRHRILHGEVSDYGTEINSLKAFSFLVFIGIHLPNLLDFYSR